MKKLIAVVMALVLVLGAAAALAAHIPCTACIKGFVGSDMCPICEGIGTVLCQACNGNREFECLCCSGRGEIMCDMCYGFDDSCPKCHGTASVICPDCGGNRATPCTDCSGSGSVDCTNCGGSGAVLLTCAVCGGKGYIEEPEEPEEPAESEEADCTVRVCANGLTVRFEEGGWTMLKNDLFTCRVIGNGRTLRLSPVAGASGTTALTFVNGGDTVTVRVFLNVNGSFGVL